MDAKMFLAALLVFLASCSFAQGSICHQSPIRYGLRKSCGDYLPRYTYNSVSGNCESFSYGGCHSYDNLFHSVEECETTCRRQTYDTDLYGGYYQRQQCSGHRFNAFQCIYKTYHSCTSNFDCGFGETCCHNGCGMECQASSSSRAPEKPGSCTSYVFGACLNYCYTDNDCAGNSKCCKTACGGRECTRPTVYPVYRTSSKAGECPYSFFSSCFQAVCQDDHDCPGNLKCCANNCRCSHPVSRRSFYY